MANETATCFSTIKDLPWCQGKPVYPGIKRRAFIISVSDLVGYPKLPLDELGRPTSAKYEGAFSTAEGRKFKVYDHLPAKATFKSASQGEEPSQTFKETVTLVLPGIDEATATAVTALNSTRVIAIVEDMHDKYRVIGCEKYLGATVKVERDNGQGAAGTAGTTITLEADDIADAPFYEGPIPTEDGIINDTTATEEPAQGEGG